ncbi:MAG: hypothetical protein RSD51_03475 [Malacoplasma sp.]
MDKEKFIGNAKIAMVSQIIVLTLGIVKSLLIPITLSVSGYGYWQIYMFYLPYIGFCYLGYNDGIYLRYGKYDKDDLPYEKLRSSVILFLLLLFIECMIIIPLCLGISDSNKQLAIIFVLLNIPIQGIYGTIIYILQITNQIKKYCFYTLIDKVLFILYLFFFVFINNKNYLFLIIADIVTRLIVTVVLLNDNKKLIIGSVNFKEGLSEFFINIRVGFSLMIAAFLSMLFVGIGRFFIEMSGSINEYAYYSFGMSVINLLLSCFISIGTVIYPILKRADEKSLGKQFNLLSMYFELIANVGLFIYFGCYIVIQLFFIKYAPVLKYLNILFCLAIFQGKINLINNTFYKVLREEKKMMRDNIKSTILFFLSCILCQNVIWIAAATTIVMCHRCYDSEKFLRKKLVIENENRYKNELLMIFIFFISSLNVKFGFVLYFIYFFVYAYKNKSKYFSLLMLIRNK